VTANEFGNGTMRGFSGPGETTAKSLSDLAATGANLVRVFLSFKQSGNSYAIDTTSLAVLQTVLTAGAQYGFRVAIVVGTPDNSYFNNPALQTSMEANWRQIANMFQGNPTVAGYDLVNEPISPSGEAAWTSLASRLIADIRSIDPNHVIIFEPSPGGLPSAFAGLQPLPFANIVYSTHMYLPYQFTHQGIMSNVPMTYPAVQTAIGPVNRSTVSATLQPLRDFAATNQLPVYVGEFSAVRWAPSDSSNTYISDVVSLFETENWSWTYHAWRNYPGWDAELPESYFYALQMVNAMPVTFAPGWQQQRNGAEDTISVLRGYFKRNAP
jgi:aryl-phospho-beta-D-glucosidase BglC (GH1 family)